MATYEQVIKALTVIHAHYVNAPELTDANFKAYAGVLADVPMDLLDAAALTIAATNKWFPNASELRQACFDLMELRNRKPSAYDAWGEVSDSFGPHGILGAPEWSDPLIGEALKAVGGYVNMAKSRNNVADRSRFIKAYRILQKREREITRMLPVVREAMVRIAAGTKMPELEAGKRCLKG